MIEEFCPKIKIQDLLNDQNCKVSFPKIISISHKIRVIQRENCKLACTGLYIYKMLSILVMKQKHPVHSTNPFNYGVCKGPFEFLFEDLKDVIMLQKAMKSSRNCSLLFCKSSIIIKMVKLSLNSSISWKAFPHLLLTPFIGMNKLLKLHSVEISCLFYHSDFTWNQFWGFLIEVKNLP